MFSVVFEVFPKAESFNLYLDLAKELKPLLQGVDGFIDNERFESLRRPGWILSHSTWSDEKSLVRWRTVAKHHETQLRGRNEVFRDYRLRVGEVVADTAPGASIVQNRLDETEVGAAKFVTFTEIQPGSTPKQHLNAAALLDLLQLDKIPSGPVEYDAFTSIYNEAKLALLASWRDQRVADGFEPPQPEGNNIRHRIVRIVRDYSMFDRRESPQYYPPIS